MGPGNHVAASGKSCSDFQVAFLEILGARSADFLDLLGGVPESIFDVMLQQIGVSGARCGS